MLKRGWPALVCASALLLGGCWGGDDDGGGVPGGELRLAKPVKLYSCREWREAGHRERLVAVEKIRDFAGGPAGSYGGHGATLPDDKAYDLFENWCDRSFATKFTLYKLYTRAAAFQDVTPDG